MRVAESADRVPSHTSEDVNERIRALTRASIAYYSEHPEEIERRLRFLDEEWDVERVLEANAAGLALSGTVLGIFADRKFLVLPLAVTAFLLQHAVQGWCPPLPVLRRLGIRTAREIEAERYALKAIRGDFAEAEEEGARSVAEATGRL